jgi:hypothetical protein
LSWIEPIGGFKVSIIPFLRSYKDIRGKGRRREEKMCRGWRKEVGLVFELGGEFFLQGRWDN